MSFVYLNIKCRYATKQNYAGFLDTKLERHFSFELEEHEYSKFKIQRQQMDSRVFPRVSYCMTF